jgi:two-component system nitrogen regulation response regulator GlnG
VPVIAMTDSGTAETAITAMISGAFEYLTKPFETDDILPVIDSALETGQMSRRPALLPDEQPPKHQLGDQLLGRCAGMLEVFRSIGRVAPRDVAVLILGETGTGKEVVARAIYQHSRRRDQIFHAINCAAIPETLLESELFGHEKGAFTGADARRIGKFEVCDGGTLFLDEIGDMSLPMQTKLLRVLQEKQFERVGGNQPIKSNVRILAATNRNMQSSILDGTFRSDLYYRLNEFTIHIPPLRQRGNDVDLMIDHFFGRYAEELDIDFQRVAPETRQRLKQYAWPGNVRELQGVIKQTLLKATGPIIVPAFLPANLAVAATPSRPPAESDASSDGAIAHRVAALLASGSNRISATIHDEVDRIVLREVLRSCRGNISEASVRLGISRPTLRSRMKQLGIALNQPVQD